MSDKYLAGLLLLASAAGLSAAPVANPREELKGLVARLQSSPDDQALRERIIRLALSMKPRPAVPEEAERRMGRGEAAFEAAKDAAGFQSAAAEFQAAADAAPWLAGAYFNLGVAQEKSGRQAEAIRSFRLYLLAAPSAKDAANVKKRIYKLEYTAERGSESAGAREIVAKQQDQLSGRWFEMRNFDGMWKKYMPDIWLEIERNSSGEYEAKVGAAKEPWNSQSVSAFSVDGRNVKFRWTARGHGIHWIIDNDLELSDEGRDLKGTYFAQFLEDNETKREEVLWRKD